MICQEFADKKLEKELQRRLPYKDKPKIPHEKTLLEIHGKKVEIDIEIVPIVKWLNNLSGVETQYCCQGEIVPKNNWHRPHVIFNCSDPKTIEMIARLSDKFCCDMSESNTAYCEFFNIELHIEWRTHNNQIRYDMVWQDLFTMQDFIKWLTKSGEIK